MRQSVLAAVCLAALMALIAPARAAERNAAEAEVFVSPKGKPTGQGVTQDPLDLQTVLDGPAWLSPGTVVWLMGGEYRGEFVHKAECAGTAAKPLVFRTARGARATILGGLRIHGSHTWFMDFEVTNPNAVAAESFFNFYGGDNVLAANLILHDNGAWERARNGIGCWWAAANSKVYGCLVYNNGRTTGDKGGGHGIYTQNNLATGRKQIEDSLFFRGAAWGVHAYGSAKAPVEGFTFSRNVVFRNASYGVLIGGGAPSREIVFEENHVYGNASTTCCLGWGGDGNTALSARHNVLAGNYPLLEMRYWRDATVRGNTLVGLAPNPLVAVKLAEGQPLPPYSWDANAFFAAPGTAAEHFAALNGKYLNFDDWRQLGLDARSSLARARPAKNMVFVYPNRYRAGRGHVVVYNWEGRAAVDLDLGTILMKERGYLVLDAQDYFGEPLARGTWKNGPVRVTLPARDPSPAFAALVVLSGDAIDYSCRGERQPLPQ